MSQIGGSNWTRPFPPKTTPFQSHCSSSSLSETEKARLWRGKNYTNAHWPGPITFRPELEGLQSASSGQTFLHRHEVQDNREYRQQQSNSGRTVGVPIRPNKRQTRTQEIKKKRKGGKRTNERNRKEKKQKTRENKKENQRKREREIRRDRK